MSALHKIPHSGASLRANVFNSGPPYSVCLLHLVSRVPPVSEQNLPPFVPSHMQDSYAHLPPTLLLSVQWPEVEALSFKTAAPSRPVSPFTATPNSSTLHGPTDFLLFQKDTNPFAAFDLHTDHSLFVELTCLADPGSRHHLPTSVMSHLRWSLPIFPKRRFLLASVTADHYHRLSPLFSVLSNLLPPFPLGLSSHMGPKTLTLL